ncbi:mitochondrial inner membrane protease subunit 1-like [Babylonia areolata]|uniref:mitochondrial inner membrane protease subunit 1-like n=1 Tax=Babylonia areolata TaxID=304850 RepID=UPI003FD3B5C5
MEASLLARSLGRSLLKVVQYGSVLYCTLEFVADLVLCSGPSMQPTIQSGDIVLTEHISVNFNKIQKGDVVICKSPKSPKEYICKRVIAMEGDRIFNAGNDRFTNIKRGHVWLEGDNKDRSSDSRAYGQVPYGLLRGRVFFVLWPLYRLGPVNDEREKNF